MNRLRASSRRLTVPHVLSALALFVALGGTAFAVGLAKNSVGSPQIKRGGVKTSDIGNFAVTTRKLHADAVTGGKVKNGTLRGPDIDQSTLDAVRAANVISIHADGEGQCALVGASPGVTSSHIGNGRCSFDFSRNVASCNAVASVDLRLQPNLILLPGARTAYARRSSADPEVIETATLYDASGGDGTPDPSDMAVTLTLVC